MDTRAYVVNLDEEEKKEKKFSSSCTLSVAIGLLRAQKEHLAPEQYEACCNMIATLFDISFSDTNRAVEDFEE